MKKLYFLLLFLMVPSAAWSQDTGFFIREDCAEITAPINNQTLCLQSTTTGGRTAGVVYVYTNNAWTSVTSTGAGDVTDVTGTASEITVTNSGGPAPSVAIADSFRIGGHTATAPIKIGTAVPGTCTIGDLFFDSDATAGSNFYGCTALNTWTLEGGTTAAAASVTFAPNGSIAATDVQTAIQEVRDEAQPVDPDLTALAALSTTGCLARTAANTYVVRTVTGTSGNITVTNGDCVSGNPTLDLGATAVQTDQSNTWTTGDQSMAAAASFTLPTSTGAAPTGAGRLAFDSTAFRPKYGNGTSAFTIASTADLAILQSLNANLTALSGLTGVSGAFPYWTGPGAMGVAQMVLCVNAGGNVLHVSSLSPLTFTCDASATGGLSGGTNNQGLFATGATTFASSTNLTRSAGGVIQMPNGIEVGSMASGTWTPDASAFTGHGDTTITMPWVGASPSYVFSTGAKTSGHVVKWDADGAAIDGGAAGVGDVTLAGPNTLTNTTMDEASGNVFKVTKSIQVELFAPTTDNESGDGQYYFRVPVSLNGTNLTGVQSNVVTAGTTGLFSVQITKCAAVATTPLCSGTTVVMLSTVLSIDSGETSSSTAATAAVISATAGVKAVATGDILRFDVTAIHTTPGKGGFVNADFKLP